jgi:hypothetical protein
LRPLLVLFPALLAACAAGRASVALVQAQSAVDDAADRGAGQHAAYELTMARACLTKAREEAATSSYKASVELSRKAAGWADSALIAMQTEGHGGAAPATAPTPPATPMPAPGAPARPAEPTP